MSMYRNLLRFSIGVLAVALPGNAIRANAGEFAFCSAKAALISWNAAKNKPSGDKSSSDYLVQLWSSANESVSARLDLVADDALYVATIPDSHVTYGDRGRLRSAQPRLLHFSRPVVLQYVSVDSVATDGKAPADCPRFIEKVGSDEKRRVSPYWAMWNVPPAVPEDYYQATATGAGPATAALLVRLLSLAERASIYESPKPLSLDTELDGDFGDRPRGTGVQIYVDSSGKIVSAEILRPSGEPQLDKAALSVAQNSTFTPATFLGEPVDGVYIATFRYLP